jgi:hypothetical protein
VVHLGQAALRYQAMMNGTVDAAMLMEPFIALAEKHGCYSNSRRAIKPSNHANLPSGFS